jgi:hypothetical protein
VTETVAEVVTEAEAVAEAVAALGVFVAEGMESLDCVRLGLCHNKLFGAL